MCVLKTSLSQVFSHPPVDKKYIKRGLAFCQARISTGENGVLWNGHNSQANLRKMSFIIPLFLPCLGGITALSWSDGRTTKPSEGTKELFL